MGHGCGQKSSGKTTPSEPPQISQPSGPANMPEAMASTATTNSESTDGKPATNSDAHAPDETGSNSSLQNDTPKAPSEATLTLPPRPMPKVTPGMSLPAWLKLIIKPATGCAIDQFALLTAYHVASEPPHVPNEALIKILRKIFPDVDEHEAGGTLLLFGVRWLSAYEIGPGIKVPHGVSMGLTEVQKNARRCMEFLLTEGKLPNPRREALDSVGAAQPAWPAQPSSAPGAPAVAVPPAQPAFQPASGASTTPAQTALERALDALPKRNYDAEFKRIKEAAEYDTISTWLEEVLVEDPQSVADSVDILNAYDALHENTPGKLPFDAAIMAKMILDVFAAYSTVRISLDSEGKDTGFVMGLRWRKLESSFRSTALAHCLLPEKFRNEAHKLLHVPDPTRTRLWLKTVFMPEAGTTISIASLFQFYERTFWRWTDTHPHLERDDFCKILSKTFCKCKVVEVSKDHRIIVDLGYRDDCFTAKQVLADKQRRDLRRLQRAGEIDPPKTAFAQKLLQDPLLMRVREDKKNRPIQGSYNLRTRRRGGDPETRERDPFGDEEPGFPGLSMKRQQARYKRELEEYAKKMTAAGPEVDPNTGLPAPHPQQPTYGGEAHV